MKVIARINTSFYSGSEIILAVGKKNMDALPSPYIVFVDLLQGRKFSTELTPELITSLEVIAGFPFDVHSSQSHIKNTELIITKRGNSIYASARNQGGHCTLESRKNNETINFIIASLKTFMSTWADDNDLESLDLGKSPVDEKCILIKTIGNEQQDSLYGPIKIILRRYGIERLGDKNYHEVLLLSQGGPIAFSVEPNDPALEQLIEHLIEIEHNEGKVESSNVPAYSNIISPRMKRYAYIDHAEGPMYVAVGVDYDRKPNKTDKPYLTRPIVTIHHLSTRPSNSTNTMYCHEKTMTTDMVDVLKEIQGIMNTM